MKMADDDFITRALSSLSNQMALANVAGEPDEKKIEAHAQSLVDEDKPKIDSSVKSYLSLVAARSVVASEIDVLSENVKSCNQQLNTLALDMKGALTCARKLRKSLIVLIVFFALLKYSQYSSLQ